MPGESCFFSPFPSHPTKPPLATSKGSTRERETGISNPKASNFSLSTLLFFLGLKCVLSLDLWPIRSMALSTSEKVYQCFSLSVSNPVFWDAILGFPSVLFVADTSRFDFGSPNLSALDAFTEIPFIFLCSCFW
ncbi:hypothetical protein CsSME_00030200 [Camellia sinensis var. sinensis]